LTATVNVRVYYQPHCPECMKQVEETVSSAIRDNSVAGLSMVAQNKCEHDALAANTLPAGSKNPTTTKAAPQAPPAAPPQGMAILPGIAEPTNGFDTQVN
jgi:hypothetical protein